MLQDSTNHPPPPEPYTLDHHSTSCPPSPPITRSTSSTKHRPITPSTTTQLSWREEESILKHQLRNAKAEIQQLQAKLGIKSNAVPFNTSSPRKTHTPSSSPEQLSQSFPSDRKLSQSAAASSPPELTRSPSSLRTRRVSTATSNGSLGNNENTPPLPPPPSVPIPPVPSIPATRIPLPSNSSSVTYAPVGPVAMNRALLSNEAGGTNPASSSSQPPSSSSSSSNPPIPSPEIEIEDIDRSLSPPPILLAARQSRLSDPTHSKSTSRPENPFFSSGTPARERLSKSVNSAMSGSGKVISGLQSDLLQARTGLESTRGQLRLSQRAVDFLGRQNEDLKETKERLNMEIESLTRQLTRRERTGEETLTRARTAESSLTSLREEYKSYVSTHKSRNKELEESEKKAREEKQRLEGEYAALREGMKSMSEGWKRDLEWLKQSLSKSEKELEIKSNALTKLLSSRSQLSTSISTTMTSLSTAQTDFHKNYSNETGAALKSLKLLSERQDEDREKVEDVQGEMGRLRRNIERAES